MKCVLLATPKTGFLAMRPIYMWLNIGIVGKTSNLLTSPPVCLSDPYSFTPACNISDKLSSWTVTFHTFGKILKKYPNMGGRRQTEFSYTEVMLLFYTVQ